ncbi:MAG TPA: DoxX family membrane protein [Gammaproteobacteria bacterium]|nr:DoxX family membrane protein [Gammaproteobacteria bacterium]
MSSSNLSFTPLGLIVLLRNNLSIGAPTRDPVGPGYVLLAAVMIALGLRGLVFGDFAGVWQRIPISHLPAQSFFIYVCAVVELAAGVGLLVNRTARIAAAVLTAFSLLWVVLLKMPAVIYVPSMEATWADAGEIAVILAGAWTLMATLAADPAKPEGRFLTGRAGVRNARLLLVLALPAIGLSHFFYTPETAKFVPAWLPYRSGWAYLTGTGDIAAAAGILLGIWPRLAVTLEAAMLSVITLLVWLPVLIRFPADSGAWSAFLMSTAIACGAWAVADSYRHVRWLSVPAIARKPSALPA